MTNKNKIFRSLTLTLTFATFLLTSVVTGARVITPSAVFGQLELGQQALTRDHRRNYCMSNPTNERPVEHTK
jgi:hypothetical protein